MLFPLLILTVISHAEPQYYIAGKPASKVEAVIALAQDNTRHDVVKCQAQELSDKATLRNKKVKK